MVRFAFALFALSAAGCAVDAAGPELALDAPPLSESWTVSTSASVAVWDSGLNGYLSSWMNVHCNLDYGDGYMLTGINVNQEDLGASDNFIARMAGECWEFDLTDSTLPKTNAFEGKVIFEADLFRTGVFQLEVPDYTYPIGLDLQVSGNGNFVKDVRIAYAPLNGNDTALDLNSESWTNWALGYGGDKHSLRCPEQSVMTGLALRYDIDAGKIRTLKIHCRELQP
ncbi:hypothetical protein WMF26_27540 [Sorangium sp. So ce185]|uniref:hypothetical protein n=1 Tax=Sorangium sp. So ce185 TaxID=3133287 RepID=UPI003F638DE4